MVWPRGGDAIAVPGMPPISRTEIEKICLLLELAYGNPRHGNKQDPLDELIYIILSTRTRDDSFRQTFKRLRRHFGSWNEITEHREPELRAILKSGGLATIKTRQILDIFRYIREHYSDTTLAPLANLTDPEAEAFLTALPGVGQKIAKCVLMYSLARKVLPVDVHVHRVASRLGFRVKKRPDTSQELIEAAVPPKLRYGFHVNAVAHGRALCLPRRPKCERCPLTQFCRFYHLSKASNAS